MKFSTSIEYAVHGLIYLAKAPAGRPVLTSEIGKATSVPEAYLRKVFQQLGRSGLVTSQTGARGGFRLSRDASQISLRDVVEGIDGSLPLYTCLREIRGCNVHLPCPVQSAFEEARRRMAEVLEATSIKDLLVDITRQEPVAEWLQVSG